MKLWMDDERAAPEGWVHAETVDEAIEHLLTGEVTHAALDHDMGFWINPETKVVEERKSGTDMVNWMIENNVWPTDGIVVHTWNPGKGKWMCAMIDRYGPYDKKSVYRAYGT